MTVSFKEDGSTKAKRRGPDSDAVHAVVLTIRFFVQDNEACSFRNMAQLYRDSRIPNDLRVTFERTRTALNQYLDSEGSAGFHLATERMTPRKIFEAVVYGDLSHATAVHRERHDRLFDGVFASSLAEVEFVDSLIVILKAAFFIGSLNSKVLSGGYLD